MGKEFDLESYFEQEAQRWAETKYSDLELRMKQISIAIVQRVVAIRNGVDVGMGR